MWLFTEFRKDLSDGETYKQKALPLTVFHTYLRDRQTYKQKAPPRSDISATKNCN
jgi:hypothetical protein